MEGLSAIRSQMNRANPKELNPYLKDNGSGCPDNISRGEADHQLLSSSVVGDGGVSWRLKALKRAKEQAAREGRKLDDVVEERWGSLGQLAASMGTRRAAPVYAHLDAIKKRKRGHTEKPVVVTSAEVKVGVEEVKHDSHDYLQDASFRHPKMNRTKGDFLLSKKSKDQNISLEHTSLVSSAMRGLNTFPNDGYFLDCITRMQNIDAVCSNSSANIVANKENEVYPSVIRKPSELCAGSELVSSMNQLAAKIFQLRIKGKHEEAAKLSKKMEGMIEKQAVNMTIRRDTHPKRILTLERCNFCFESPSKPKHLVISIANFTYLMLPRWEPVVEGHCFILPVEHNTATRTVDKNVWAEIRNFKKCLLRMFARQNKDVVFLETVTHIAKQHRHCIIECIPIPFDLAKEAPMYFKKAMDEAEGDWCQHEMKKVILTSGNLWNVIPPNMSYFHVEFGLDRGFVHVIDDDNNFPSSFGLNVVRGMLCLPEDMHRRRSHEPLAKQRQAVAEFVRAWEPFDWTRDLD